MNSHSFTRQELYDLVWSEPIIELAARYGISGNGLAKACGRADIPVPERGYWAKQQAGYKVQKTPLPPAQADTPSRVTIRPPEKGPAVPEPPPVPASVQEKIENERKSGKPVMVPATLSSPHRIIAGWLQDDRRERRESWLRSLHKPIDGTDLDKRRLRILSALFKALEARGYQLTVGQYRRREVQVASGEDKLEVQLEERIQQVRRQLTEKEKIDRGYLSTGQRWTQEKVPTGELMLKVKEPNRYGMSKEWRETRDSPIDDKLGDVLAELAGMLEEIPAASQARSRGTGSQMENRRRTPPDRIGAQARNHPLPSAARSLQELADSDPHPSLRRGDRWLPSRGNESRPLRRMEGLGTRPRRSHRPLRSDALFNQEVSDHEVYTLRE